MTTHSPAVVIPQQGRRLAFIGKGGTGKSTIIAHMLKHWNDAGIPGSAMDADEPGDEENGSLIDWADEADLGGPVYPAPNRSKVRDQLVKYTPESGLLAVDTGAWNRKAGNMHFAVLAGVDLAVLTLPPTRMELNRAGSVLAAIDHLEEVGAHVPRLVICLTLTNASAKAADDTYKDLTGAGFTVLKTRVPRVDAQDGYGQSYGLEPKLIPGSPMDLLAAELAREASA
ncbi:hypothetical protein [Streptomyces sp. H27-H5]|uniref:hypothetical protein n=1 Tax=Streptomyces sp. H27-H5 TaxID=2996460 RepID=UPI00226FCFD8|nr:hypothetical protein [Streptomyces sp. H27-H5]MCY0961459.1 hypothetical protein [Streptomyces sp. H27-H5]